MRSTLHYTHMGIICCPLLATTYKKNRFCHAPQYFTTFLVFFTLFENYRKSLIQHCERSENVYILSGHNFIKNAKNSRFSRVFWKPEAYSQTVWPDSSILIGQKQVKNVKIQKLKWDISVHFQTMCFLWDIFNDFQPLCNSEIRKEVRLTLSNWRKISSFYVNHSFIFRLNSLLSFTV